MLLEIRLLKRKTKNKKQQQKNKNKAKAKQTNKQTKKKEIKIALSLGFPSSYFYNKRCNLFPVDARITKAGTQEMSYGTCESAGEKAIGLDQDKRKNWGGGRVKQTNPKAKRVKTPLPPPHKGASTGA